MEKLIGLLLIVIGALTFYSTYISVGSAVNPVFFFAIGLVLVVLGVLLFTAKAV